ncbi:phosphoadenylyl-sulfate reductase [Rhodobacteraceae bacterium RKSG542]|uniref:phosphoadenylyl-sulfate reductase n=1 Tax=Pseudovibrio flavus TaxID=2529854 RepID=UPI0012BD3288|nr:phosphoadenylyl-sulfate reductase [Pseudovibrio flavus]MTI17081.1 phosphoadenylyl-sulfate reductase [Pseudovibrio flavus]
MARGNNAVRALNHEDALPLEAAAYDELYGRTGPMSILRTSIEDLFVDGIVMVSSFGADSAVLLHMVSQIDKATPVVFVDTGKHFGETRFYRDQLIKHLGLTGVRSVMPESAHLVSQDPKGDLWLRDSDQCCHIRKVLPLDAALDGYSAWISGRKRHQADTRKSLPWFEADGPRIKVNPLADWDAAQVLAYARENKLPPHPLVAQGYPSIGCMPCTDKVAEGEDPRAGRWRGKGKTECGIHLPSHGKQIDGSGI